jgi:hypothetical protein
LPIQSSEVLFRMSLTFNSKLNEMEYGEGSLFMLGFRCCEDGERFSS